jgi:deoxyribose-phosphate aldolase
LNIPPPSAEAELFAASGDFAFSAAQQHTAVEEAEVVLHNGQDEIDDVLPVLLVG